MSQKPFDGSPCYGRLSSFLLSYCFAFMRSCLIQRSFPSICFFSSRRRHTRWTGDWSSDVCSSDLNALELRRRTRMRDEIPTRCAFPVEGRRERSEERRVGKECRSRWSPYHAKKTEHTPPCRMPPAWPSSAPRLPQAPDGDSPCFSSQWSSPPAPGFFFFKQKTAYEMDG